MARCLFTDEELDETTKEEHTIPRSLGGRIKSFDVSSSAFNARCGERVDPYLAALYAEAMLTLGPLLTSEARSASKRFKIAGQAGWWQVDDRNRLTLTSVEVEKQPGGLPASAIAATFEALEPLIRQLARKGVKVKGTRQQLPKDTTAIFPEKAVIDWRVDIALIKSILLTFDDRLKHDPNRFTRDAALEPIRRFVREIVESDSETPNVRPLADFSLGLQYESEYLTRFTTLREGAGFPAGEFQHTLIVSADPWRRTLDGLFWAFETDPHAFRLSSQWDGGRFSYVITNGILVNQVASEAIRLSSGLQLGKPNHRRCMMNVSVRGTAVDKDRLVEAYVKLQKASVEEISSRRFNLFRQAVDYIERQSDESVQEQLSRLARLNHHGDHKLSTAVFGHLAKLYTGAVKTVEGADEFINIVARILDVALADELFAEADEDAVPNGGWDYWLGIYRECLDALKPKFGLPGHFFGENQRIVSLVHPSS